MWRGLFFSLVLFGALGGAAASAETVHSDTRELVPAEVLEIVSETERTIAGTGATTTVQDIRIVLEDGERAGEVVRFENDMVELAPGDSIFVFRTETLSGVETVTFADFERRPTLIILAALFVGLLVLFAGWHGIRSLLSLLVSVGAIVFVMVPALLAGYSPVLTSVGIAAVVLALVLFGTHGFKPRTYIAFAGTLSAVVVTGALAYWSSGVMRLTGFGADESVYLNFASGGQLDLAGLLLGGIIIGILGVLDDISITQASMVEELKAANQNFGFRELYERASRVGKHHLGSLVNTLALAYVGVSLPLILLYAKTDSSLSLILNQEIVASELLRIIVGSIGLILAVPCTTAGAAWYFKDRAVDAATVDHEQCGHHH